MHRSASASPAAAAANDSKPPEEVKQPSDRPQQLSPDINSLARVEVQLILQFLSRVEVTRVARCSQRLYTDADQPIVWQHIKVLSVTLERPSESISLSLRRSLAFRHCRVQVTLRSSQPACIEALLSISRLHSLKVNSDLSPTVITRILHHDSTEHLKQLTFLPSQAAPAADVRRTLDGRLQLPRELEELSFPSWMINVGRQGSHPLSSLHTIDIHMSHLRDSLASLARFPRLTHLKLTRDMPQQRLMIEYDPVHQMGRDLSQCKQLTTLHVDHHMLNAHCSAFLGTMSGFFFDNVWKLAPQLQFMHTTSARTQPLWSYSRMCSLRRMPAATSTTPAATVTRLTFHVPSQIQEWLNLYLDETRQLCQRWADRLWLQLKVGSQGTADELSKLMEADCAKHRIVIEVEA
jgi:hypothetical protein